MVFFEVSLNGTEPPEKLREQLRELVTTSKTGEHCDLDLLHGEEYSYLQIGAWIGDQGLALRLMGLGQLLGLWQVMTPKMMGLPKNMVDMMVGMGMISIIPPAPLEVAAVSQVDSTYGETHD